ASSNFCGPTSRISIVASVGRAIALSPHECRVSLGRDPFFRKTSSRGAILKTHHGGTEIAEEKVNHQDAKSPGEGKGSAFRGPKSSFVRWCLCGSSFCSFPWSPCLRSEAISFTGC